MFVVLYYILVRFLKGLKTLRNHLTEFEKQESHLQFILLQLFIFRREQGTKPRILLKFWCSIQIMIL